MQFLIYWSVAEPNKTFCEYTVHNVNLLLHSTHHTALKQKYDYGNTNLPSPNSSIVTPSRSDQLPGDQSSGQAGMGDQQVTLCQSQGVSTAT